MENLFLNSIKNIAVISLIAYPLTKSASFRRSIIMMLTLKDKIFLILIFGGFSILGNLLAIETFNGALIDSRIVGPVVGGIVVGPMVGIWAGIIGGVHRFTLGGFTVVPDFVGNVLAGVISGIVFYRYGKKRLNFIVTFLTGCVAEICLKILTLILAKPAIVAVALVHMMGLTTILVNATGISIFVIIVQDVQYSKNLIGANYAEKALEIARRTLPILKKGFNKKTANEIAKIIYDISEVDAVSITDRQRILIFKGIGAENIISDKVILTDCIKKTFKEQGVIVVNSRQEMDYTDVNYPFSAVVIAPLVINEEIIGLLKVYKAKDIFHSPDISMITGIASFLSLQLQYAKIDEQSKLLAKAEYYALKAQINPHFLFNALSVIKLLIRTDPKQAQNLIVKLAALFRRTLNHNDDLLPFTRELEIVEFYMSIQKARFGERLNFQMDIDEAAYALPFPAFALQPLVENSMNHGLSKKKGPLNLWVAAKVHGNFMVIEVVDNGIGLPYHIIEAVKSGAKNNKMGIGLRNIQKHLQSIYGNRCSFCLQNTMQGAKAQIRIPIIKKGGYRNDQESPCCR